MAFAGQYYHILQKKKEFIVKWNVKVINLEEKRKDCNAGAVNRQEVDIWNLSIQSISIDSNPQLVLIDICNRQQSNSQKKKIKIAIDWQNSQPASGLTLEDKLTRTHLSRQKRARHIGEREIGAQEIPVFARRSQFFFIDLHRFLSIDIDHRFIDWLLLVWYVQE